jgi:hypothetical protein
VIILGALLGLLLGLLLVAMLRLVAPALFPAQGGFHYHYYVGVLPSNPDGTFARRDYWIMAIVSCAGAVGCLLLFLGIAWGVDGLSTSSSPMARLIEGLGFALVLLFALCIAAALVHVGRALRWRPRRLACDWSPDELGAGS